MSWIASLVATWLKPHDRHNTTTKAAAAGSSGRVVEVWAGVEEDIQDFPAGRRF